MLEMCSTLSIIILFVFDQQISNINGIIFLVCTPQEQVEILISMQTSAKAEKYYQLVVALLVIIS